MIPNFAKCPWRGHREQTNHAPLFAAVMAATLLAACNSVEHATIYVKYAAERKPGEWRIPTQDKRGVEDAFKRFTEANGYECRADFKYPQDTNCHGPKDLLLDFKPSPNLPEFVATFRWSNSADRTHEEFGRLVTDFQTHMSKEVGSQNVRRSPLPES